VTDNLRPALPLIDGSLRVDDARTIAMVFRLIKDEGVFVGASSALNVVAAGDVARERKWVARASRAAELDWLRVAAAECVQGHDCMQASQSASLGVVHIAGHEF
jgi:cysteine synthase